MLIFTSRLLFPPGPALTTAQQEKENALSWQSATPPPPSSQLLGAVSPSGSLSSVIQGACSRAAPLAPAIGWQTVVLPAASVSDAVIKSAAPVPGIGAFSASNS